MERKGEGPVLAASAGGSGRLCPSASPPCAAVWVPASASLHLLWPWAAPRAQPRGSPSLATTEVYQRMDLSVREDLGMKISAYI